MHYHAGEATFSVQFVYEEYLNDNNDFGWQQLVFVLLFMKTQLHVSIMCMPSSGSRATGSKIHMKKDPNTVSCCYIQ
jgi:hypothetical protein